MEFDIKKFLVENNLTLLSTVREEEEEDFADVPEDSWNQPQEDDFEEFEKEPSVGDVKKQDSSLTGIHKKQADLKALEDKKDALLMQLKSNIITLDQYKDQIGNVPAQIKKLRADLEKAMDISIDDSEEESI